MDEAVRGGRPLNGPDAEAAMEGGEVDEPPIEALRDFAFPSDGAFADDLRRRIDRRVVTGEMVRLSTRAVCAVLMEFLSLFKPSKHDQE